VFVKEYITSSYHVDINSAFEVWLGRILSPDYEFIIVAEEGRELEVLTRMIGVGFEKIRGFLKGGILSWK